jgi:predicted nuclease with TOPRIM domain
MAQRLLEGEYDNVIDMKASASDEELRQLRQENRKLDEALRAVRNELERAIADKENLERSIRALRNQLAPLHRFLRALFGEIELAVGEENVSSAVSSPSAPQTEALSGNDARWQSYKNTFPGVGAKIIDALLAHDEMNYVQLSALLKHSYDTIKGAAAKLMKAGALTKNGKTIRLNR